MVIGGVDALVAAALGLFWVGMLGLLWRRSLIGMLVGAALGWLSVAVAGIAFLRFHASAASVVAGSVFVACVAVVCVLQVVLGLAIVYARIARRGSLDAQDAGLLEG